MHDFHTHSNFSIDSNWSIGSMCNAALKKGLKGICFTDHHDFKYPDENIDFEYNKYINEIENNKSNFGGILEIYSGIELGIHPEIIKFNKDYLKTHPFDFIIGSIHTINGNELYEEAFLSNLSERQRIIAYMENAINTIKNFNDFDVLGHIDVFRRYVIKHDDSFVLEEYIEFLTKLLSILISNGKGIEINTSGKRYKLNSFHPVPGIIKLYKSLGGEIVTLGSDAHRPDDIGYKLKEAMQLLKDYGFNYYTFFKDRKPVFVKIE